MKRIVILIDGTWRDEDSEAAANIAWPRWSIVTTCPGREACACAPPPGVA